jgi:tRNA dimethylallyltransferase
LRLLLLGPTAVGKTDLSIILAKRLDAEIISADSRQCYRYTDIGTAKPAPELLQQVPHFNISVLDPNEKDSAAAFYERSTKWEQQIRSRGKNILHVGGSTLHLQSLIQPLDDLPEADEQYVAQLQQQIKGAGIETLYQKLRQIDPEYAQKMDGRNPQRIIRALDVWQQTGRPFSSFHTTTGPIEPPRGTWVFGLERERQRLYDRINYRTDRMIEQGFLEEVRHLLDRGYARTDPGLNTVGYKDAIAHLKGETSYEQMIRDMKTQTRRYAKRQLTWFRRWKFIQWIDMDKYDATGAAEIILKYLAAKTNKV